MSTVAELYDGVSDIVRNAITEVEKLAGDCPTALAAVEQAIASKWPANYKVRTMVREDFLWRKSIGQKMSK